jgi:butyrate kinase
VVDIVKTYVILAVNTGSTSTKIAVFENEKEVFNKNISHDIDKLKEFKQIQDQLGYRKEIVEQELKAHRISIKNIEIFVGRGGGLVPIKGGTYLVNSKLIEHASKGMSGQHPAQLASQICNIFVKKYGGRAYVVNPPDVDEFEEIARITGLYGVYRESKVHALNQKEVALRYCNTNNKKYENSKLIVCHIGGGISVTAHNNGRMVDSNDIINGDGPMTPTRAGALPITKVVRMCYSGRFTEKELYNKLTKESGLIDHLGTSDIRKIEKRIMLGDRYAKLVYNAMIYQIGKSVGAAACVLKGKVDAIILTGGIANSDYLVSKLDEYISWISKIKVIPGEFEMEALAAGALRVVRGEEEAILYTGHPIWSGVTA